MKLSMNIPPIEASYLSEISLPKKLIPWRRSLLEKLTVFPANSEILSIIWNTKVHNTVFKRARHQPLS